MKKYLKYGLVSVVLLVAEIIGVSIIKSDKSNNVLIVAEAKQDGYATQPSYVHVEASSNKKWHDTWESNAKWLIILGFILAAGPGVCAYLFDGQNGDIGIVAEGQNGKSASWAIWVTAALSLFLIFIPYAARTGSSSYETKMCTEQYNLNKTNLDELFPSVDNEQLLKDCQ